MTTNNHPANGPVSLERLHQISEILSKASAQSDGGNLGYAMADAVKVIAWVLSIPATLPCPVHLEPGLKFGKRVRTQCVLDALRRRADYYAELEAMTPEQRAEHDAGIEAIKAMLPKPAQPDIEMLLNVCGAAFELADDSCQQDVDGEECHVVPDDAFQKLSDALDEIENTLPTEDVDRPDVFLAWSAMPRAALKSILQAGNSPVTPDGYVLVPIVPTEDMIINGFESVPDPHFSDEKEWEEYEALSGCRQAARRAELCWAAMIKAAPKQENI